MDLDELLSLAVKRQASDLHLKANTHPVLRIHGHLEVQDDVPLLTRELMRRTAMRLLGEGSYNDPAGGAAGRDPSLAPSFRASRPGRQPAPGRRV